MQPGTNCIFLKTFSTCFSFNASFLLLSPVLPSPPPPTDQEATICLVFCDLGFLLLGSSCNCFIENLKKILETGSHQLRLPQFNFHKRIRIVKIWRNPNFLKTRAVATQIEPRNCFFQYAGLWGPRFHNTQFSKQSKWLFSFIKAVRKIGIRRDPMGWSNLPLCLRARPPQSKVSNLTKATL